jgi:hypothetical protein
MLILGEGKNERIRGSRFNRGKMQRENVGVGGFVRMRGKGHVRVCLCVGVQERERGIEIDRDNVCVWVCKRVRESNVCVSVWVCKCV